MFERIYLNSLLILLLILSGFHTRANDSIKIKTPIPVKSLGFSSEKNYYLLNRKNISVPFPETHVSLFSWILLDKMPLGSHNPSYPWGLKFTNCSFSVYGTAFARIKNPPVYKYLLLDNCILNNLTLINQRNNVTLTYSKISSLVIDSAVNCELSFNSNKLLNILTIENSKNIKLDFQNNYHQASSGIFVQHCSINKIYFVPSYNTECEYDFFNDTITDNVNTPIVFPGNLVTSTKEQRFYFRNCYINADFLNFGEYYNSSLTFENCSFGPKAYLGGLGVSKLTFRNCRNTPSQLSLGFGNDSTDILLRITNTDVSNFKFDFPENVKLFFASNDRKDVAFNTFESLLNKYRLEGKHDSYRNVDIQYKAFTQNKITNWLDNIWWYYGYRKYYVFYWMLLTLIVFYFINFKNWNKLKAAYPIIEDENNSYYDSIHSKYRNIGRKIIKVIIFTSFIFFSLNMNFSKLSFKKTATLAWIFVQYIIGLTFLFLILNYVIKGN